MNLLNKLIKLKNRNQIQLQSIIMKSGLFDEKYYFQQNKNNIRLGNNPIEHYCTKGIKQDKKPNSAFDPIWYRKHYKDVKDSGMHPFIHYILYGKLECRFTNKKEYSISIIKNSDIKSLIVNGLYSEFEIEIIRKEFNEDYYIKQNPDIVDGNINPLYHYLKFGTFEGRRPCASFDPEYYRKYNKDVLEAGTEPFYHYLVAGKKEGRLSESSIGCKYEKNEFKFVKPYFSSSFYLSMYPDVKVAGIDPLEHYMNIGHLEGRDPSKDFSTTFYLKDNPDVVDAGINPFYHYIASGQLEKRFPQQPGGYKTNNIWNINPINKTLEAWKQPKPNNLVYLQDLINQFKDLFYKVSYLVFSHDIYNQNVGGIQLCLDIEADKIVNNGQNYLHLSPYQTSILLSDSKSDEFYFNLTINNSFVGITSFKTIMEFIALFESYESVIIHAFQGHSPELLTHLLFRIKVTKVIIWIHDSFTLCPSYTLQRNGIDFCNLPNKKSQSCSICIYGSERPSHEQRLINFFQKFHVEIIAPSLFIKDFWTSKAPFKYFNIYVIPHCKLINKKQKFSKISKIKIAFVGYPVSHKGWNDFISLKNTFIDDDFFKFHYFSSVEIADSSLMHHAVCVNKTAPLEMQKALSKQSIDIVFMPSEIPETFSFAVHEAISAGAKVMCYSSGGNIPKIVKKYKQGWIFDNLREVEKFLTKKNFVQELSRKKYYDIQFNNFSLEIK